MITIAEPQEAFVLKRFEKNLGVTINDIATQGGEVVRARPPRDGGAAVVAVVAAVVGASPGEEGLEGARSYSFSKRLYYSANSKCVPRGRRRPSA